MIYLNLFFEFCKIGLFALGGGMATVPFLMNLSEKTAWFTSVDLANFIAISESTPGPIGVNMATYVGFSTAGYFGALCSTLGLIFPSILIIVLVYYLFMHFYKKPPVQVVLKYLRAAVIGLIAYALFQVVKITIVKDSILLYVPTIFLVILTFLIIKFKKIHPIIWIITGALLGILFL